MKSRRARISIVSAGPLVGVVDFRANRGGRFCTACVRRITSRRVQLCWCPPGHFVMGSPKAERERRADEDQVEVRLTQGFWMAKYETTQAEWKRVMGKLPGPLTAELPDGD